MADPYSLLGLSPQASLEDAEEAYHHRLLRCHPDLHASEGPEALARAEAQTRELNDAIDRIRHGWRAGAASAPGAGTGAAPGSSRDSSTRGGFGPASARGAGFAGASGFGAGSSARQASGSRFAGRSRSEPWPAGADRTRDHPPVPCPFCGRAVSSLADFEDHLAQAHPAQDRGRRRAARRHARAQRWWWPVPLWLFAAIDAALVGVTILLVAAYGGHWALVDRVLGEDAPRRCVEGEVVRTRLGTTERCNPDNWPLMYIFGGVMIFVFFVVYRWTTTRQDR